MKAKQYPLPPGGLFEILLATWRDLSALRELEKACFPLDAWPLLDLVGILIFPQVIRLKAVVRGEMVGFIAVDVRQREDLSWVATFGVLPGFRRCGIGSALLMEVERRVPTSCLWLSVRRSNAPALNLYRRFGYRQVEVWPRYYRSGEDALVLEKNLRGRRS